MKNSHHTYHHRYSAQESILTWSPTVLILAKQPTLPGNVGIKKRTERKRIKLTQTQKRRIQDGYVLARRNWLGLQGNLAVESGQALNKAKNITVPNPGTWI